MKTKNFTKKITIMLSIISIFLSLFSIYPIASNPIGEPTDQNPIFPFEPVENDYITKKVRGPCNNQWVDEIIAVEGSTVEFKITIKAIGNNPLEDIMVYDFLPYGIDLISANPSFDGYKIETYFDPSTGCNNRFYKYYWSFSHLHAGQSKTITLVTEISDFPLSDYLCFNGTNVAVIDANVVSGGCNNIIDHITESDDANVIVPRLSLTKHVYNDTQTSPYSQASPWRKSTTVNVGDKVDFRIRVGNTGNKILHNVIVEDTLPSFLVYAESSTDSADVYNPDDFIRWNLGDLIIGEISTIEFSALAVSPGKGDNAATATCSENLNSYDEAEVIVKEKGKPDILVTKKASVSEAHEGDLINYEITVKNTGYTPLYDIIVEDATLDILFHLEKLDPKESKSFDVDHVLSCCPDPFVNKVCAEGYDEFENKYSDCDEESVDVISGNIKVTKEGDICEGYPGDIVKYTITVENTGDDPLFDILVEDIDLGIYFKLESLDAGASKVYHAEYMLDCCEDPFVNTVTVEGFDKLGKSYFDSDTWSVDVICEEPEKDVSIEKNVKFNCCGKYKNEITADVGDFVKFRINVTNTGEATLDLSIIDELPEELEYNDVTSYDYHTDNKYYWNFTDVEPLEKRTVTFRADVKECGYLINKAIVVDFEGDLYKYDTANVDVVCIEPKPDIEVTKTANRTWGYEGDIVNYTIVVKNTGDADLYNIVVDDSTLGIQFDILVLNPGSSKTFYVEHVLCGPVGLFKNTVEAEGYDEEEKSYTDSDTETVEIRKKENQPGIKIDKKIYDGTAWVDELSVEDYPADVKFKITVENIGDCDLSEIIIKDLLTCGLENPTGFTIVPDNIEEYVITWSIDSILSPNDKIVIEFTATAYINTTNIVNVTAYAECTDEYLFDSDSCDIYEGEMPVPDELPAVEITNPVSGSLYLINRKISLPFQRVIILGGIDITAEAEDDNFVKKVEFYIDDETEPREIDTNKPYNYTWDERIFGSHKISVKAYDSIDQVASDEIEVFIINFGLL